MLGSLFQSRHCNLTYLFELFGSRQITRHWLRAQPWQNKIGSTQISLEFTKRYLLISEMLLGVLLILGFIPGPAMFENNPDVVGGIFMVYLLSNFFLLIAGILATPLFVYVLRIPKVYLIPSILLLCSIWTFALQASVFDLQVMFVFGLIGLLFRAANYPLAPVVIDMILGPILEANLRRSCLISREGYWIFWTGQFQLHWRL